MAKQATVSGNWVSPDYLLNTGSVPQIPPVHQVDVVTGDKNVVGIAASGGVYIYEEEDIVINSSIIQLLRG